MAAETKGRPLEEEEKVTLRAEAEKHKAEARKFTAEAEIREATAIAERIGLEREQEKRVKELSTDDHYRVYNFVGPVSGDSVRKCMAQLSYWNRTDKGCSIEIIFNSPGGSVIDGMALWDFIQKLKDDGHVFTTVTRGYAASMGGILLQAGDIRVMGKEAYMLIHEIQAAAIGTMGEIEDEFEFLKKIQERILNIFVTRSGGKITKRQLAQKWKRKNWWIDSTEALKLGLVDDVQ